MELVDGEQTPDTSWLGSEKSYVVQWSMCGKVGRIRVNLHD